ncbi:MAG: hypothetical protein N2439_08870, partial [Anaerolineae bacterium]|nr:hypothetical protein [Anaerolineae bacterium]
ASAAGRPAAHHAAAERPPSAVAAAAGPGVRSEPPLEAAPRPVSAPADAELRQAVRAQWDRFLAAAGKQCGVKVQAALRSVKEIDVVNSVLIMRFSHAFARDLVNQNEYRSQVEMLWDGLLKAHVTVRCALVGEPVQMAAAPAAAASNDDEAFLAGARDLGAVVKKLS